MHDGEWRTAYYSVTLGITIYTYYPGVFAQDRAIRGAQHDAAGGYEGSAPVRVEYTHDGREWHEYARYAGANGNGTFYSHDEDAHYCACGSRCEWLDDTRYEGSYALRCEACAATYWDTYEAPLMAQGS